MKCLAIVIWINGLTMPYFEKMAIAFLKEMNLEAQQILNEAEHLSLLVEQLHKKYSEFIEKNPDLTRSEAFKILEKDLKNLQQTCRFVSNDCKDICHGISDCGVELN